MSFQLQDLRDPALRELAQNLPEELAKLPASHGEIRLHLTEKYFVWFDEDDGYHIAKYDDNSDFDMLVQSGKELPVLTIMEFLHNL